MFRKTVSVVLLAAIGTATVGCQSNAGNGTAIGGGVGAGVGAVAGSQIAGRGNRTEGALVGAGAGALIGGLSGWAIGREGDKKEEARKRERDRQDRYYTNAPAGTPAPAPAYQQPQQPAYPAAAAPAAGAQPMQALTKQDVILWAQRGTKEDIIIDRIDRSGTRFYLSAADENQLRDAGVSEAVIRSMKATASRP